jgi:hypothetical protein
MEESVTDSTSEAPEERATVTPGRGAAALAALARGLPITLFHHGRPLRLYPDGRLEDLETATAALEAVALRTLALGPMAEETAAPMDSGLKTQNPALAKFELPNIEIPAAFREFAETVATLANASFDNTTATTETMTAAVAVSAESDALNEAADPCDDADACADEISAADIEAMEDHTGTMAATAAGTTEYGLKIMEAACINANAMIEFASVLLQAKSLSEMVLLSTAHARRQIETVTEQTKQLAAVAEKMAAEQADLREGVETSEHPEAK